MSLPEEILYEVFRHLYNPQELITCSMVCTQWNTVIHQPRLWYHVDLSGLSSAQMVKVIDDYDRSLGFKLQQSFAISVSCPSSICGPDLENIAALIRGKNTGLKRICIERVQMSTPWAMKVVASLPESVECVSLRQTLAKPRLVRLMVAKLPNLKELDLSYTLIDDLDYLGQCSNLQTLCLDAIFTLSGESLRQFLEHDAPLTLQHLSVKHTLTQANWIFGFIKRQIRANRETLKSVDLERCDMITYRDIDSLQTVLKRCKISHTAILTEDTLDGYRQLIEKLSLGVVSTS